MEKIYSNSEEKYLKSVVLYAIQAVGGAAFGLFYDVEGTKPAHNSDYDWKDLFMKGLVRVCLVGGSINPDARNFYAPYRLFADSRVVALQLDEVTPANFFADEENESPDEGGLGVDSK